MSHPLTPAYVSAQTAHAGLPIPPSFKAPVIQTHGVFLLDALDLGGSEEASDATDAVLATLKHNGKAARHYFDALRTALQQGITREQLDRHLAWMSESARRQERAAETEIEARAAEARQ